MRVAVDTGPLVALLDARDSFHRWTRDAWGEIEPPLFTCEAVLAEATYLVRNLPGGPAAMLDLVERGVVGLAFQVEREIPTIRKLMSRFAPVPMSFADACLVRMAEMDAKVLVMTLDFDFRIYRKNGRQVIPLITPR